MSLADKEKQLACRLQLLKLNEKAISPILYLTAVYTTLCFGELELSIDSSDLRRLGQIIAQIIANKSRIFDGSMYGLISEVGAFPKACTNMTKKRFSVLR